MLKDEEVYKRLEKHEGFRSKKYKCSANRWTIGIGHNLEAREFTPEEKKALGDWENGITRNGALMLLRNDVALCLKDLQKLGFWYYLDDERQYALLDMCFQLGWYGLSNFKKMLEGFRTKNFVEAARQCLDSKYARVDSPTRAKRIATLIKFARWVEYEKDLENIKI